MKDKNKNILSIDAETNGLWGDSFAIAAILYNSEGSEIEKIVLRVPDKYVTSEWVKENVIPTLNNCPVNCGSRKEMLKRFAEFYMKHKDSSDTLWHMGHVVEAYLFRELVERKFIGEWDAPYTPIEVSTLLLNNGYRPDSVDNYIDTNNITLNNYGTTHNPLYDCEVAARVYFDLNNR